MADYPYINLGKVVASVNGYNTSTLTVSAPMSINANGNTFNITLPAASSSTAGYMSVSDKLKLDGLPVFENLAGESEGTELSLVTTGDKYRWNAAETKLNGIEAEANKYMHPVSAAGAKSSGLYKITTDANGHIIAAIEVSKSDITALGVPESDTTYDEATTSTNGLMSFTDKAKLDMMSISSNGISTPETISNQSVASFTSAIARRPLHATVNIQPTQAGSGNPYPQGGGRNLLDISNMHIGTNNGITFSFVTDECGNVIGIDANGFSTADRSQVYITIPDGSIFSGMKLSGCPVNNYSAVILLELESSPYTRYAKCDGSSFDSIIGEIPSNTPCNLILRFDCGTGVTIGNFIFTPMIRQANDNDSTFVPYSNIRPIYGHNEVNVTVTNSPSVITITPTQASGTPSPSNPLPITGVTLPQAGTVYGGTLDVERGLLTVTNHMLTFDGTESFIIQYPIRPTRFDFSIDDMPGKTNPNNTYFVHVPLCSHNDVQSNQISGNTYGYTIRLVFDHTDQLFGITEASLENVRAFFTQQYNNGTPVQVTYPLANPITYQLTPQEVKTALLALGYNGSVNSIDIPSSIGTVYGGTLDVARGVLTVTHVAVEFASLPFLSDAPNVFYTMLPENAPNNVSGGIAGICTHYTRTNVWPMAHGTFSACNSSLTSVNRRTFINDNRFNDLSEFQTFVNTENPRFIYPLASPVTYQLTPQQLVTLAGTNNIFADCGSVNVTYWPGTGVPMTPVNDENNITLVKNILTRMDNLETAIVQMGGTI